MSLLATCLLKIKALFNERLRAFKARWLSEAVPDFLPRKDHRELNRAMTALEAMLRRILISIALDLNVPPRVFDFPPEAEAGSDMDPAPHTSDAPATRRAPQGEPRARAVKPPAFHIGELRPLEHVRDNGPRILTFDQIIAMPARVKQPVPEMKSTARLQSRIAAFLHAYKNLDQFAQEIAQQIADGFVPYLQPIPRARTGTVRAALRDLDPGLEKAFAVYFTPPQAADSSSAARAPDTS